MASKIYAECVAELPKPKGTMEYCPICGKEETNGYCPIHRGHTFTTTTHRITIFGYVHDNAEIDHDLDLALDRLKRQGNAIAKHITRTVTTTSKFRRF